MVYFIADLHLFHKNIILYEDRPFGDFTRFGGIEKGFMPSEMRLDLEKELSVAILEMNETIITNWNKTVNDADKIFVLGDVGFPLRRKVAEELIPSLHGSKILVMGNHDRGHSVKWWMEVGFKEVSKYPIIYSQFYILSHEPVNDIETTMFTNIHGHIHGRKREGNHYINVGVEHTNYFPISFDEIKSKLAGI